MFQGDFTQVHVTWSGQHLVIRCAALEPTEGAHDAFMSLDPRRVVLLEAEKVGA